MKRGYFGIAILNSKFKSNLGTLIRTAHVSGADFIATIGPRYKHEFTDTSKATRHIPLFQYDTFEEFYKSLPRGCKLVGIELEDRAQDLCDFEHPSRACYLLGAEDRGIPQDIMDKCDSLVKLKGEISLNVAVAGSIVVYDRINQWKN